LGGKSRSLLEKKKEREHLFQKIDHNSDGSVSWEEFTTFMLMENSAEAEDQSVTPSHSPPYLS
jgi:Ca2+-binding EF-hand superfamily protein